jgi:DNA-binding NarL/FixJ family response regulator
MRPRTPGPDEGYKMIRILVVDDSRTFRDRLRSFLAADPELEVVGEAEDGPTALRAAGELRPDIVLMDVRMDGVNGLDATRQLKAALPGVQVIILSLHDLEPYRAAARAAGASAYVTKRALVHELLPAVRQAAQKGGLRAAD